jgi:hypothetical protein
MPSELLYPQNPDWGKRWLNQAETCLFQGHAEQIAIYTQQRHKIT